MLYAKICTDIRKPADSIHNFQPVILPKLFLTAVSVQLRVFIQDHSSLFKEKPCIAVRILDVLLRPQHILRARQPTKLIDRRLQNIFSFILRSYRTHCLFPCLFNRELSEKRPVEHTDHLQLFLIENRKPYGIGHSTAFIRIAFFKLRTFSGCLIILPDIQLIVIPFRAHQFFKRIGFPDFQAPDDRIALMNRQKRRKRIAVRIQNCHLCAIQLLFRVIVHQIDL